MPYCSIEEAWGSDFAKSVKTGNILPSSKNSKCVPTKSYSNYNDLVNPSNNSVVFSRTMKRLPNHSGPKSRFEPLPINLRSDDFKEYNRVLEESVKNGGWDGKSDYFNRNTQNNQQIETPRNGQFPDKLPGIDNTVGGGSDFDDEVVDEEFLKQLTGDDIETEQPIQKKKKRSVNRLKTNKYTSFLEKRIEALEKQLSNINNGKNNNLYDLCIYICMGIILIFILEIFVKLGGLKKN